MHFLAGSNGPKLRIIFIFFGLAIILFGYSFLNSPTIPVRAESGPTPTPTPEVSRILTDTSSLITIPFTLTASPISRTTPIPTQTPVPGPTVTPTLIATVTPTPTVTIAPTPTPTPLSPEEQAKKQKEEEEAKKKEEQEKAKKEILEKAKNHVLNIGQPDATAIDLWLLRCQSPQVAEASPDKSIGQLYIELGWKYGINPAYAVAFFTKESSCGTAGNNLASHNFGNIRWTPGYPTIDGIWRAYPTWAAGMEDWFKLIKEGYFQFRNAHTLADILPIYAPEFENDTTLYMNQVMDWVDTVMKDAPDAKLELGDNPACDCSNFVLGAKFADYYQIRSGLKTLGLPIGNQEYEYNQIVQYFERGVLEYHPENKPGYQVMQRNLGRVANQVDDGLKVAPALENNAIFFKETGHRLSEAFVKTWKELGGVAQLGFPIAEPQTVGTKLVQWFERGRLQIDLVQVQAEPKVAIAQVGQEALSEKQQARKVVSRFRASIQPSTPSTNTPVVKHRALPAF